MQSVGFLRAHFECEVKMENFALLLDGFLTLYLSGKFWQMVNMERIGRGFPVAWMPASAAHGILR
jgi:hypothetical protein